MRQKINVKRSPPISNLFVIYTDEFAATAATPSEKARVNPLPGAPAIENCRRTGEKVRREGKRPNAATGRVDLERR